MMGRLFSCSIGAGAYGAGTTRDAALCQAFLARSRVQIAVARFGVISRFSAKGVNGAGCQAGFGTGFTRLVRCRWQIKFFAKSERAAKTDHQTHSVMDQHPNRGGPRAVGFECPRHKRGIRWTTKGKEWRGREFF